MNELTHLSLFSGFGGLDLAAEQEGFATVGQCEWADYPTKVLEKHWPTVPRWKDIRTLTGDDFYAKTGRRTVDVLSGGFPCQPFSVAGQRRGTADDRFLWPEMLRVIREIQPTWVLGENVAGLLSMAEPIDDITVAHRTINRYPESDHYLGIYTQHERMLLGNICKEIEACGYEVTVFCVPACGVDAPHRRDRIAIVAHANGGDSRTWWPEPARQQWKAGFTGESADVGDTQHDGLSAATLCGIASQIGFDGQKRTGETFQPAGASGQTDNADVADAQCRRLHGNERRRAEKQLANSNAAMENTSCGGRKQPEVLPQQPGRTEPERASDDSAGGTAAAVREDVADSQSVMREESKQADEKRITGLADGRALRSDSDYEDVQHANGQRCKERDTSTVSGGTGFAGIGRDEAVANADNARLQIAGQQPRKQTLYAGNGAELGGWWPAEPQLGRVAYGVPSRVERLKGLGNAAAPPQFRPIYHAIHEVETMIRNGTCKSEA